MVARCTRSTPISSAARVGGATVAVTKRRPASRGRHAALRKQRGRPVAVISLAAIGGAAALAMFISQTPTHSAATKPSAPPTTAHRVLARVATVGPPPSCVAGTCLPWRFVDTWDGSKPVAVTTFHPTGQAPSVIAYAAWLRTSSIDLGLYPGYKGPGPTSLARGPQQVPTSGLPRLLATFNSGFYEADEAAGFFTNHTLYFPMVKGEAALVRFRSGALAIESWHGGATPPPSVLMARQNLTLLVSGGRPTPATADNARWGLTLGGVPAVWRSAIGIDEHGNLLYAAAPFQTAASMAAVMVRLHAVTAMELDINPEWPIFVTYGGREAVAPQLDVANPNQTPTRFLYSSTKDFFAVFARRQAGEATPW